MAWVVPDGGSAVQMRVAMGDPQNPQITMGFIPKIPKSPWVSMGFDTQQGQFFAGDHPKVSQGLIFQLREVS